MTKTKVEAIIAEALKMNQSKPIDAHSKPKRDPSSSRKEIKRYEKARRLAPGLVKSRNKLRTVSEASSAGDGLSKDSQGKSDSSSETSDCTSEENRADKQTNNCEIDNVGADAERTECWGGKVADMTECDFSKGTLTPAHGIAGRNRAYFTSVYCLELRGDRTHDDLLREIDDLRSENDYLKVQLGKAWYVIYVINKFLIQLEWSIVFLLNCTIICDMDGNFNGEDFIPLISLTCE